MTRKNPSEDFWDEDFTYGHGPHPGAEGRVKEKLLAKRVAELERHVERMDTCILRLEMLVDNLVQRDFYVSDPGTGEDLGRGHRGE